MVCPDGHEVCSNERLDQSTSQCMTIMTSTGSKWNSRPDVSCPLMSIVYGLIWLPISCMSMHHVLICIVCPCCIIECIIKFQFFFRAWVVSSARRVAQFGRIQPGVCALSRQSRHRIPDHKWPRMTTMLFLNGTWNHIQCISRYRVTVLISCSGPPSWSTFRKHVLTSVEQKSLWVTIHQAVDSKWTLNIAQWIA